MICNICRFECGLKYILIGYFYRFRNFNFFSIILTKICRMRYEVDIKNLRCDLKKEKLIPRRLYIEIDSCQARRGHQDYLWEELLSHLKSLNNESVENTFINIFDTPRHQGLYECFLQNFPSNFDCSCGSWF